MRATLVALGLAALLAAAGATAAHAYLPETWIPKAAPLYEPVAPYAPPPHPLGPFEPHAGRPLFCPHRGSFDVMQLVGKAEMLAAFQAIAHGCRLRVAISDGRERWLTLDLSSSRVNVEVADGIVVRIIDIG